ncbi:DUF2779 domain-containing protein [Mycoplasma phocoeninasale]|uniref:DUF2779 domain-containing protein n=1 Tax=Mycoplasma phocoeninasale TaxID=2726117 RepID=A0A858U6B8_9MOLU|nr:DUF2779 domain-containing protein [Mycoplasma phocoeninasale]MBN0970552.1 DUF2779 domain-containing protein [Mycoplasma phocoeninasale]QJG66328.1 DUF2779 domain-containing protein [Mycoplasma phocoeninasale]
MNPNYVYIDFEAITNPFARLINIPSGTPYAYTLGLLDDKNTFKVKTFIMDFKKHATINSMWAIIRKRILQDINNINQKLSIKNVIFIGHNPVLENKCIKKLFPENKVEPLIQKTTVSLSKLTAKFFNKNYFSKTKNVIESTNDNYLKNALIDKDGAIASFLGYWLYVNSLKNLRANDKKKKFLIELNEKNILKELHKYSYDDVVKMLYVASHPNDIEKWIKELSNKRELLKQINNLNLDEKLTVKDIKEKIWNL